MLTKCVIIVDGHGLSDSCEQKLVDAFTGHNIQDLTSCTQVSHKFTVAAFRRIKLIQKYEIFGDGCCS